MTKTFISSDHHFGHRNIIKFTDSSGNVCRPFQTGEEHDAALIECHNKVVSPQDKVYLLGDLAISKKDIPQVSLLNGRKTLIQGNHDIFNTSEYTPYVENVRAYRVLEVGQIGRVILSHIPVHPNCLERFILNVHGHLHSNVLEDPRYVNVSMERLRNYQPVDFQVIVEYALALHKGLDVNWMDVYQENL